VLFLLGIKPPDVILKALYKLLFCVVDYAAWRNEIRGSYFIQEFCEVMSQQAHQEHFADIITQVTGCCHLSISSQLLEVLKNIFITKNIE